MDAIKQYEVLADHAKTAIDARSTVDKIQAKLSPSSSTLRERKRRQADPSTVGAVSSCNDFSIKYLLLLDELIALSDNNVGLIKQLVAAIDDVIEIPCDDNKKETLKAEADFKVNNAKANAEEFKKEKEKTIEDLVKIVREAQRQIEEANESLLSTVAALTPIFTVPTEVTASQQGSSASETKINTAPSKPGSTPPSQTARIPSSSHAITFPSGPSSTSSSEPGSTSSSEPGSTSSSGLASTSSSEPGSTSSSEPGSTSSSEPGTTVLNFPSIF